MIVGSRIRLARCPSSECLPVRSASAVVIDTVPDLRRASPGSRAAGQPGTNSARRGGEAHPRALQEPEEDDDGPGQSDRPEPDMPQAGEQRQACPGIRSAENTTELVHNSNTVCPLLF